jgi:hypothetical protein
VILADTSIWIDHFRAANPQMESLLNRGKIATHPWVVAEIALASMKNRRQKLDALDMLRKVRVARLSEIRQMIEARSLYAKGVGLTDAHLMASCLLTPGTQLWTRDAALQKVAASLRIQFNPRYAGKSNP